MLQYMVAGMMLEMIVTIIMVKYISLVNLIEGSWHILRKKNNLSIKQICEIAMATTKVISGKKPKYSSI